MSMDQAFQNVRKIKQKNIILRVIAKQTIKILNANIIIANVNLKDNIFKTPNIFYM